MTPILIVKFTAMLLWCHAAVLSAAWVRAVARSDHKSHIGHFVSLVGELVPMAAAAVVLIFGGALLGFPSVVVVLTVVVPAGVVLAFLFEVDRLSDAGQRVEAQRLAATLAMAVILVALRGHV
ncbi:MAG: hypothetical protein KDA73_01930 [Rhodobacteraceae bacterium]|nr:hypothetical protein [Paracoccaceae bacterium]